MHIEFTPAAVATAHAALDARVAAATPLILRGVKPEQLVLNLTALLRSLSDDQAARLRGLNGQVDFNARCLDDCQHALVLLWEATADRDKAEAQATDATVPAALIGQATELRALLHRVLEYHLWDVPAALTELARIRAGQGHQDLALDLQAQAELIAAHAARLAGDQRMPADAQAQAHSLADAILNHLTDDEKGEAHARRLAQQRIIAVLNADYTELSAAARFALRNTPIAERFTSLFSVARR